MHVLVCGQRDFFDLKFLYKKLDAIHAKTPITKIINGAAPGADSLSTAWAKSRGVEFEEYPAEWKRYRKAAGPIRNQLMLDSEPDIKLVVAFYHDKESSKGTKDMVSRALKKQIGVYEYETKTNPGA